MSRLHHVPSGIERKVGAGVRRLGSILPHVRTAFEDRRHGVRDIFGVADTGDPAGDGSLLPDAPPPKEFD
ncbi:MAG: hypothetical protein JWO67_7074 [Streptosporangiaceae bacterium]|jgi:hypothetical protein|nr:hypothetical protein [Streptosporangiaceae bacterium]